jgi:hypothetical protein
MSRFHRKTAPGVRNGRVRHKNNWKRTPNCYNTPQRVPAIDRRRPGEGYRHLLQKRDIERFVNLIPDWDDLCSGLDVIVLDVGRDDSDGWYRWWDGRAAIGIHAWPLNRTWELDEFWYDDHRGLLTRIGTRVETNDAGGRVWHWTPDTARAYQLCHVFLHELGHHHDRMTTRSKLDCSRGERYAEGHAWVYEGLIWERYLAEFGLPD